MINQSDVQGRLRLFRYGVIAVVIFTFAVTLFALYSFTSTYLRPVSEAGINVPIDIGTFLGQAITATIIALVIGIIAYVAYYYFLTKKWPWAGGGSGTPAS